MWPLTLWPARASVAGLVGAISGTAGNGTTLTTALAHAQLPNGPRVYIQSELSAIATLFTLLHRL